jgi:large-conductance mechanosensitive channel
MVYLTLVVDFMTVAKIAIFPAIKKMNRWSHDEKAKYDRE